MTNAERCEEMVGVDGDRLHSMLRRAHCRCLRAGRCDWIIDDVDGGCKCGNRAVSGAAGRIGGGRGLLRNEKKARLQTSMRHRLQS